MDFALEVAVTINASNRESHIRVVQKPQFLNKSIASQADANNRAVIGAERKVTEEFPKILQEYLDSN